MNKQTPTQLHKQYDVFGNDVPVLITYQYIRTTSNWKFTGYKCKYCTSSFKFVASMMKHGNNCKVLNKLKGKENANTNDNS